MKIPIFSSVAQNYWNVGLPAMPLIANSKKPALIGWTTYCDRLPTPEEQGAWLTTHPKANIGLPLGSQSGLCMLDIDTDDEKLITAILEVLPQSPWARVGKKGMALAYRWSGQPNFKLKLGGEMAVELLGSGNQLVLPPSIHPDTRRPYTANANLWEVLDQIPVLDPLIQDRLCDALGVEAVCHRKAGPARSISTVDGSLANSRFAPWLLEMQKVHAETIRSAPYGDRNDTFFVESVRFANHVAAAQVDWALASEALRQAGADAGLTSDEMRASLASAWRSCDRRRSWMNAATQWIYCSGSDCFFHPPSGAELSPNAFEMEFGHLSPHDKGTFRKFIVSRGLITVVQGKVYLPDAPPGVITADQRDWYNEYRPSKVAPIAGDASPFVDLLEYMIPTEAERVHLTKVLAHIVRNPGVKLGHAVLIQSRQTGIGKSTLMEIIEQLVGESNFRKVTSDELLMPYSSYVYGNVVVLCEEVNLGVGYHSVNRLKDAITAGKQPMRRLYENTKMVTSFSNYFFFTNLRRPLQIDSYDRRYFVLKSEPAKRDKTYWREFRAWFKSNLGVIRQFLDEVDLSDFDAGGEAPMTAAKEALISDSATAEYMALQEVLDEGPDHVLPDIATLQEILSAVRRVLPKTTRPAVLDALQDYGAINLGQMNVAAVGQSPRRLSLWALRNADKWKAVQPAQVAAEFRRARLPTAYANVNVA